MSRLNILDVSKHYIVRFECPECKEESQDTCIDCYWVKCHNCGSEIELEDADLEI